MDDDQSVACIARISSDGVLWCMICHIQIDAYIYEYLYQFDRRRHVMYTRNPCITIVLNDNLESCTLVGEFPRLGACFVELKRTANSFLSIYWCFVQSYIV